MDHQNTREKRSKITSKELKKFLRNDPNLESILKALDGQKDRKTIDTIREFKMKHPEAYQKVVAMGKFVKKFDQFLEEETLEPKDDPRTIQQLLVLHTIEQFILERSTQDFDTPNKVMGYVEQPPGTGKTRIMTLLTDIAFRAGLKVLILTPQLDVNQRTYNDLVPGHGKRLPGDPNIPKESISVQDRAHNVKNPNAPVQICSYQSLRKLLEYGFRPDIIIRDELHESLAEQTNGLTNIFSADKRFQALVGENNLELIYKTPQIAFSATPFAAGRHAIDLGFTNLHRQSVKEAMNQGFCPREYFTDNMNVLAVKNATEVTNAYGEIDIAFQDVVENRASFSRAYNADYEYYIGEVKHLEIKPENAKSYPAAIRFTISVDHAHVDAAQLNEKYHRPVSQKQIKTRLDLETLETKAGDDLVVFAMPVDGDTDSRLREKIYELYNKRKIKILCGKDVLNQGVDLPVAEVAHIPPTLSPTVYTQRIGRFLRKLEGKVCAVFDYRIKHKHSLDFWSVVHDEAPQLQTMGKSFVLEYAEKLREKEKLTNKEKKFLALFSQFQELGKNQAANIQLGENARKDLENSHHALTIDALLEDTHIPELVDLIESMFEREIGKSGKEVFLVPTKMSKKAAPAYAHVPPKALFRFLVSRSDARTCINKLEILIRGKSVPFERVIKKYLAMNKSSTEKSFFERLAS